MKKQSGFAWRALVAMSLLALGSWPTGVQPALAASKAPTLRFVETNGVQLRIAEMGSGPLVLLVHGFPESWYSWRHQLPALAAAGYHAVAPDMRGYGKSDKPEAVEAYDIHHLTADLAGLVDALGQEQAVLIGHDWGALIVWNAMLLHPQRFSAVVGMSVPYSGRGPMSITQSLQAAMGDNFFYILYFQEPGVAEKEFDADPRGFLSRLYLSPDSPREPPVVTDPKRSAGGWIPRMGASKGLPSWLTQAGSRHLRRRVRACGLSRWHQLLPQLPPQLGNHAAAPGRDDQRAGALRRRRQGRCDSRSDGGSADHLDEARRARPARCDSGSERGALGPAGGARGDEPGDPGVPGGSEALKGSLQSAHGSLPADPRS